MSRPRLLVALASLSSLAFASAGRSDIVVVEAAHGGEAAKAHLEAGDRLVSWRRAATKTAPAASGAFRAPWDVDELELAEVPHGPITVVTVRAGRRVAVRLGVGEWRLKTRPDAESEMALWKTLDRANDLTAKARYAEAKVEWEKAREASLRSKDDRLRALVLRSLGRTLVFLGDSKGAEEAFREMLVIRARINPGGPSEALALVGLGSFLSNLKGQEKEGDELIQRAIAMAEKSAPGSLAQARVLLGAGFVATRRYEFDEAARWLGRSLALASRLSSDGEVVESCYNSLGQVARARGDFAAAEADQRRALQIVQKRDPEGISAAAIWNSLGVVLKQRGDLAGAEEAYGRAAVLFEKAAPGSMNVAGITANLGNLALERGDLALAEERHRKALAIREKLAPEGRDLIASLANLARVLRFEGRTDDAKAFARRGLDGARKIAPGSLVEASNLMRVSEIEASVGEWPAAEEHVRTALAIGVRLAPGSVPTAGLRHSLAEALLSQGKVAEALPLAKESAEFHRRVVPGSTSEAMAWDVLAKVLAETADDAGAEAAFESGLSALEEQADKLGVAYDGAAVFATWTADVYRDYIDFLVARGRGDDALHVLERSRARRLLSMLKTRDVIAGRLPEALAKRRAELAAAEEEAEKSLAALDPEKDAAKLETAQAKLRELRTSRAGLFSRLAETDPLLARALHPEPLDLAGIRAALDPGTLFLAFSVEPTRTLLFSVSADAGKALEVRTIALGADALRREVEIYRSLLASGDGEAARARVQAGQLGELLLGPAAASLAGAERLLLAPDGPLLTLPFGAIVAPGGEGAWLVERMPFVVAPSATAFAEMRHGARAKGPARLVVFADPALPGAADQASAEATPGDETRRGEGTPLARYRKGLAPLPGAREEAKAIADLWRGPKVVYTGTLATKGRAHRLGRSVRYLHFATHALVDLRFPMESALALAPEEASAPVATSGLLSAWDIVDSMRLDADLVTLSGCETGLGPAGAGEGLVGLARAFQIAGARTVAASLWAVSDRSTKELMARFYRGLARGERKDDALRDAQRALIKGEAGAAFTHPWHWAAFELFGDGR